MKKFNAKYNVKGREAVCKAREHKTGLSDLNLTGDLCLDVLIKRLVSNPPSIVGVVFYDRYENLSKYQSKEFIIYKVNDKALPKEARHQPPVIAVFRVHRELIEPIMKDKALSEMLNPVVRKQNKKNEIP